MRKLNRVLSTIAVTITTLVGLPHGLSQVSIAQTRPAQTQFSWWRIFQNNPPLDETAGGKRGDFCAIAPLSIHTNTEIWSDRPLFVWQGILKVGKIEVRPYRSDQVLWGQAVQGTQNSAVYTGSALEPGQTYEWVILDQQNKPIIYVPFKIMDDQERDRIRVRLTILEQQLKETRATPEEMALQRANYFAQKQLWSDVLKEAYSVENPSAELEEILQTIPTQLCLSPTPSAATQRQ